MRPAGRAGLASRLGSSPVIPLGLAAVVAVVGGMKLGTFGLWRDEAFSARLASLPLDSFLRFVATQEPNGSLYHGLLFGWVRLGTGEAFLRAPSVLFAAASVAVTYLLGQRLFGRRVAVVGGILLASNALFLGFAQETRSYALLVLTSTASSLLFARAVLDDDRIARRSYPFVAAAAMYAHYFAALTIVAQFASLALLGRRPALWRRMLPGALLTAVLTVPLVAFTLRDRPDSLTWIAPTSPRLVQEVVLSLLGGRTITAVVAVLALVAVASCIRPDGPVDDGMRRWPVGFLLALATLPLAVGVAASLAKPLLVDRYFVAVLPPLLLLVAYGAVRLDRRLLAGRPVAAVTLAAIALALSPVRQFPVSAKPDSRGAVEHVMRHARAGDGVAPLFWGIPAYQWYGVRRHPRAAERLDLVFPGPRPHGLTGDELWRGDFLVRSTPLPFDPRPAEAAIHRHARLWTIEDGGGDRRSVLEQRVLLRILGDKRECGRWSFRGVVVRLYAGRCPSTQPL